MSLTFNFATVICAALIEAGFGYPPSLLDRVKHPVMWMGALIERLDQRFNHPDLPEAERRRNGWIALGLLLAAFVLPALALQYAVLQLPAPVALVILALIASTLIAQRSLYEHVLAVADALDAGGVDAGRKAVAKIVGRDTRTLDEAGVARSAIESLAENFADGVVAPSVWGVLLGLPGMVAYKAINTADSMVGHRTPRHEAFGFAAAKVDDIVNLPASRLGAFFLAAAALFHDDADFNRAVETVRPYLPVAYRIDRRGVYVTIRQVRLFGLFESVGRRVPPVGPVRPAVDQFGADRRVRRIGRPFGHDPPHRVVDVRVRPVQGKAQRLFGLGRQWCAGVRQGVHGHEPVGTSR